MRRSIIVTILLSILTLNLVAGDDGQQLYEAGQYADAVRVYDRIIAEHPDWEEAHFGRGAALYKAGQTEEALREFEKAIPSKDPEQKAAAFYNLGNAFLENQKLEESLRFYKRALELNPRDYDAKHNFELARQMMQQQQNQQPQNQPQNQDQQEEGQNQPQNPQQQPDDPQQDQEQEESQPQQKPQQQRREKEKSQEEAAQVLDALKDNEKKMMQERMKTKYSGMKKEKDW